MEPVPLIAPQAFRPLTAFSERMGDPLRLPPALGVENASPLPLAYAGQLLEKLAVAAGTESFGLHAGASTSFEDTPLGEDVRDSLTVGKALATAAHASARYCAGQRLWITQHGDDAHLHRRFPDALRRGRRQANDFALRVLIDVMRQGAGPCWRPSELHLEGPAPGHAEELAALAERSTRFGAPADCLVFPRSVLALPLPPRPVGPGSLPLPEMGFVESVRQTIRWLLEVGELTLPNVAEAAGTSVRSLQRRLAASGLGFVQLADEARFLAASRSLRDPAIRIIDVAVELGYTDAANFTRAFRRWAGVSPLAFRRAGAIPVES